ncbi:hypothetical protein VTK56DRAFT_6484 [Thermocarpiscus australiensis]
MQRDRRTILSAEWKDDHHQTGTATLSASLNRYSNTSILALKIMVPMLWLQRKLSPLQFLLGGTALVRGSILLDFMPPRNRHSRVMFN